MPLSLSIAAHPLLDAAAFVTTFPKGVGGPTELPALLSPTAVAPLTSSDDVRAAIRDLLRHGGYKPTGRGKPASEYLIRAVTEGTLSSINAAVDTCNAVSLHSGLPISVIDLSKASAPFRIDVAPPETTYVFNASGQTIDVTGLLCLFDATGPCANAVKDAQRTKTTPETTSTLTVMWGCKTLGTRTAQALSWYVDLLKGLGAEVATI